MTISTLSITSSVEGDEIAIGQKIDFTLTTTGSYSNDRVRVEVRKSHDDSVVIQTTVSVTANSTLGSLIRTWSLKTTRGLELCTGVTDGSYYLYAVDILNPLVYAATQTFDVVLITIWMLKNVYMAGIPFKDYYNNDLEDSVAENCIQTAIEAIEEDLKIYWYPKQIETTPAESDAYEISRLTYVRHDVHGLAMINLPHYYVFDVEYLNGYFANTLAIELPDEWLQVRRKRGLLQIVATTTAFANVTGAIGTNIIMGHIGENEIPHFWATRYKAGWNECNEPFPKTWLNAIGLRATLFASPILSDALKPGVSSMSLSMDGVSESEGTTASAIYSLLSARVERYQKEYDRWLKSAIAKYRGFGFTVI